MGNFKKALTLFEVHGWSAKELYESYPQNTSFKKSYAVACERLGDVHIALGYLPEALPFFEEENKLFAALHKSFPQSIDFKKGLAISYEKIGLTHGALHNLSQAEDFFKKDIELSEALHKAHPQNTDFKNGLATAYILFGQFYKNNQKKPQAAAILTQKGHKLFQELVQDYPNDQIFEKNYEWAKEQLNK